MGDRQDINSVISMWRSAKRNGRLAQTLSETPIDVLAIGVSRLIEEGKSIGSMDIEYHFLRRFRDEDLLVLVSGPSVDQETGDRNRTAKVVRGDVGSNEVVARVTFRMELPGDVKLACGTLKPFYEALYYDILDEVDNKEGPPFKAVPSHTTRLDKLIDDDRLDEIERDYG